MDCLSKNWIDLRLNSLITGTEQLELLPSSRVILQLPVFNSKETRGFYQTFHRIFVHNEQRNNGSEKRSVGPLLANEMRCICFNTFRCLAKPKYSQTVSNNERHKFMTNLEEKLTLFNEHYI